MSRRRLWCLMLLSTFGWGEPLQLGGAGEDTKLPCHASTKHDTDKITALVEPQRWILSIRSPMGISQANLERTRGTWPEQVVIRLYLRGLESLQITNEHTKLDLSIPSGQAGKGMRQWQNGDEKNLLDPTTENWLKVQLVDLPNPSDSASPSSAGYFEIQLPRKFLQSNPQSITLKWIDFFRN